MVAHLKSPLPAWIVLPLIFACAVAVVTTWGTGSLWLGLATALIGALAVAWYAERTLRGLIGAIAQIARGDRYAALPARIQGSALAAETMRQSLIDADAIAVDLKSREAETRLR